VVRGQTVRPGHQEQASTTMRFLQLPAAAYLLIINSIATSSKQNTTSRLSRTHNNSNQNHVTSSPTRNQHRHNVAGSAQLPQKPTAKSPRSSQRSIQRIQRRQRSSQPSQRITRHHPHRRGGRTRNHDPTH